MPEYIRKAFTPSLSFKAGDAPGALSVEFATLNVLDLDGDITLPGAFGIQEVRIQSHGHNTSQWTIGKGTIKETDGKAVMDGQLNLDMDVGKEAHASLKFDLEHGSPLQEWSYIFEIQDADFGERDGREVRFLKRLKVYSVDPVFLGAGIGTRTTAVKSAGLPYMEFCEELDALVKELQDRTKSRIDMRGKEGRTLSSANVSRLSAIADSLLSAGKDLHGLLNDAAPKAGDEELQKLRLEFERIRIYPLVS
jgi:hypothetical protein